MVWAYININTYIRRSFWPPAYWSISFHLSFVRCPLSVPISPFIR